MSDVKPQGGEAARPEQGQPQPRAIDPQQLADRVYRLMLADLRLEQARGERPARRKAR